MTEIIGACLTGQVDHGEFTYQLHDVLYRRSRSGKPTPSHDILTHIQRERERRRYVKWQTYCRKQIPSKEWAVPAHLKLDSGQELIVLVSLTREHEEFPRAVMAKIKEVIWDMKGSICSYKSWLWELIE